MPMSGDVFLARGSHMSREAGMCSMEFTAYLAGEPHSDSPACVSLLLRRFCIQFNDVLDDERRQRLRPYLARTIGTRGDGLDEQRSWLAMDWLIRTYTPTWLSLAGFDAAAGRLCGIGWAIDRDAVRDAVGDAARDAAWKADGAVARDAAWEAAGDAAGWVAATAGRDALQPTIIALQDSAFELLDRMLPTEVIQLPVASDAAEVCGLPIGA